MPTGKPSACCPDPLCMACASRSRHVGPGHAALPLGHLPAVAVCQEGALVSGGACGCFGEMAALSRMLLWLENFMWVPHCPLSIPTWFRREAHMAKPGFGVLTTCGLYPVS